MTSRKFTVFIDDVSTVKPQPAPKPTSTKAPEEEAGPSSLSATEKENLHPLTGGRLRSSSTVGLKRKSSVLAIKLHIPPETKGSKKAPSLVPSKKRKVTSSSDGEIEQSRSKARRLKPAARGRRRSPELTSIAEEKDERLARRLSQSDVDSRCYDLTVSPLANVSDAFAQISPSSPKDSKMAATAKRVCWIFLTFYTRRPSHHYHFTDWFCRARTPRLCPLSCRCNRYCHPFHPCPSVDPRDFSPSSNIVHSREEADLRFLHVFIPDTGISRTQTQTACYSHIWGFAGGLLIPDSPFANLPSRTTPLSYWPPNRPHVSSHVLSADPPNSFVVTKQTTRMVSHLRTQIYFHPRFPFLYLFSDPWYNLPRTFA